MPGRPDTLARYGRAVRPKEVVEHEALLPPPPAPRRCTGDPACEEPTKQTRLGPRCAGYWPKADLG